MLLCIKQVIFYSIYCSGVNSMFQIGIFSTNSGRGQLIREAVTVFAREQKLSCLMKVYSSYADTRGAGGEDLLKSDIVIIDFADVKESAMLINQLCEKRRDLPWICAGAEMPVFLDLLLLRPSGYIPDIRSTAYIKRLLGRLVQFLQRREQSDFFAFKCEGALMKVPYAHISYFESSAKKVTLHLYNSPKKYYITAKLDDIQNAVPAVFLRCHQSYLVNMNCIRFFDSPNKKIVALPNEEVLISRRMLVAARERYEGFIKGRQEKNPELPNLP